MIQDLGRRLHGLVDLVRGGALRLSNSSVQIRVKATGAISAEDPVMTDGVDADNVIQVKRADGAAASTLPAIGVAPAAIASGAYGYVTISGPVATTLDTSGATLHDPVYVKNTNGISLTAGTVSDKVGLVLVKSATASRIYVMPEQTA